MLAEDMQVTDDAMDLECLYVEFEIVVACFWCEGL